MNLPVNFNESKRILLAGIGGGFDVFTGIPIWTLLRDQKQFVFSNYNGRAKDFTNSPTEYPEKELKVLLDHNGFEVPVYVMPKVGTMMQERYYKRIVEENKIDTIIAVDGGVDSLMQGDEAKAGTMLEDFASLVAIGKQNVKKYLVCAGFGTEMEEDLSHYHVLENMSSIAKQGGFFGCCSLLANSDAHNIYKEVCEYVWQNGRKSHIQTKIISSVEGCFGNDVIYEDIEANVIGQNQTISFNSLLSSIYWFFDLDKVLQNNKLASSIERTLTSTDVLMIYRQWLNKTKLRPKQELPL